MTDFARQCFVCGKAVDPEQVEKNKQFNLPVCSDCKDTDREKEAIAQ